MTNASTSAAAATPRMQPAEPHQPLPGLGSAAASVGQRLVDSARLATAMHMREVVARMQAAAGEGDSNAAPARPRRPGDFVSTGRKGA